MLYAAEDSKDVTLWTKIPIFLDVSPCSMVGKYNISDESTASILHKEKAIHQH